MQRKPYRVLSCDAGALLALAYLPILERIEQHLGTTIAQSGEFDMLIGASTGSVVATCLKYGMPVSQIKKFYLAEADKIFTKTPLWNRIFHKYTSQPMQRAFENYLGDMTWEELSERNPNIELVVVMWNLSRKKLAFVSSSRPHNEIVDLAKARVVDILMASCSMPYVFPVRVFSDTQDNSQVYCDGVLGGFGTNPSAFGVSLLTPEIRRNKEIHVISLGVGDVEDLTMSKEAWQTQKIGRQTLIGALWDIFTSNIRNIWNSPRVFFEYYGHSLEVTTYLRTSRSTDNLDAAEDPKKARQLTQEFEKGETHAYLISHPDLSDTFGRLAAISKKQEIRPLTKEKLHKILVEEFYLPWQDPQALWKEFPQVPDPILKDRILNSGITAEDVTVTWKKRPDLVVILLFITAIFCFVMYKLFILFTI